MGYSASPDVLPPVVPPAAPPGPTPFQTSLDPFKALLAKVNPLLLQSGGDVRGWAGMFRGLGAGRDPLIDQQRQQASEATRAALARRGFSDSSIAANELAKIDQGYSNMQLGRRAENLTTSAGLLGQAAGFDTSALQNELAIPGLTVAETAAQNAGKSGGSSRGGGTGGCCFIVLEANDGILPDVVRRYRDEHCTPRKRRGYYRLAEVLVPAMVRWGWAKTAIRWAMVKPLTAYGRWHYGESRWGWLSAPLKWAWLSLFAALGWGTFRRANGEVV